MKVNPKQRRRHSAAFEAQVLAACAEPGTSVAAIALSFQFNDNLVHQWRRGRGVGSGRGTSSAAIAESTPQCIVLSVPDALPPAPSTPMVAEVVVGEIVWNSSAVLWA
jgi:transposase